MTTLTPPVIPVGKLEKDDVGVRRWTGEKWVYVALAEAHGGHFYGSRKALSGGGGGGGGAASGTGATKPGEYKDHASLIADMSSKWGGDWSEMEKIPLPLANDAAATMDATFSRFGPPPVFLGVRSPDSGPHGVIAEVKRVNPAEKGSAVFLYQHYWATEAKMDSLWQSEHMSPKSSISGSCTTRSAYARSIVQHELGHEYMGLNLHARFGKDRNEPSRKEIEPWFHNTFLPSLKTAHVSKYARKNEHEAWAELFAAATGYGTSQSHFPGELKAILDKYYPAKVQESATLPDADVTFREDATDDAADAIPCGWSRRHPEIGVTTVEEVEEAHGGHFFGSRKTIGGGGGGGGGADGGVKVGKSAWSPATATAWNKAATGDRIVAEMSNGRSVWDITGTVKSVGTQTDKALTVGTTSGFIRTIRPDQIVSLKILEPDRDFPGAPIGAVRTDTRGFMTIESLAPDPLVDALVEFAEAHGGHFYGSRKALGSGGGGGGGAASDPTRSAPGGMTANGETLEALNARLRVTGPNRFRTSDGRGAVGLGVTTNDPGGGGMFWIGDLTTRQNTLGIGHLSETRQRDALAYGDVKVMPKSGNVPTTVHAAKGTGGGFVFQRHSDGWRITDIINSGVGGKSHGISREDAEKYLSHPLSRGQASRLPVSAGVAAMLRDFTGV